MIHESSQSVRKTKVVEAIGWACSSFYRRTVSPVSRQRKGPAPDLIPEWMTDVVLQYAALHRLWGYKRIAVICRRNGHTISNKKVYRIMKAAGLLQKPVRSQGEVYQAQKLYELLPDKPNELWQTDVTYIHIPGHGWYYAVTVIDYYSRYLLACYLTSSYSAAECQKGLDAAHQEAERIHGPLQKKPFLVTDNGSSFLAKSFQAHIKGCYKHVRIQYRTPTQLGLLERFHKTLKAEEVYYRIYQNPGQCRDSLQEYRNLYNQVRPHWALLPEQGGDPMTPEDVYCQGHKTQIPKWQSWALKAKNTIDETMAEAV